MGKAKTDIKSTENETKRLQFEKADKSDLKKIQFELDAQSEWNIKIEEMLKKLNGLMSLPTKVDKDEDQINAILKQLSSQKVSQTTVIQSQTANV